MKKNNYLSSFEEDCIWMSYRYCIGRHTIAAYCHASDIAENVYGKLNESRTQFMSEDICSEIHNILHCADFINMGWYGCVPKEVFKPLDIVYFIFNKENIDSCEKIAKIKELSIKWNTAKQEFDYNIYYYNENDKPNFSRSIHDLQDLEIWQQLANLFDLKNHKQCKLNDDTICEYYECWKCLTIGGKLEFKKYKIPVDRLCISRLTYIPEENIIEDNLNEY